jgi:DNA-binding NarL/FixJ family response regulator
MASPIHIAIVDDEAQLIASLQKELAAYPNLHCVSTSTSGAALLSHLQNASLLPEVVLMDISMDGVNEGIRTTGQLRQRYPAMKVIMFTVLEDDDNVFDAFQAGAVGYLLKNEKPDFIYKTICDVAAGGALMSPGIALKTIRLLAPTSAKKPTTADVHLSDRELEVLRLVGQGYTYAALAEQLCVSIETIKKHMANVFKKLHVNNKIEALNRTRELL